jgi:hypothetical protein
METVRTNRVTTFGARTKIIAVQKEVTRSPKEKRESRAELSGFPGC